MIAAFLTNASTVWAQQDSIYILDAETLQPIQFATVNCVPTIKNDTEKGIFNVSDEYGRVAACLCTESDSILLKIRHLSYLAIDTVLQCPRGPDTLFMDVSTLDVDGVVVSAKDEGVRVIGDSIRFDLRVFRKPHHRNLEDLLNDLPGIQVSEKGQITYKGKPVGQILLRGKSTAQSQFDMINRVVKNEDISTIQLVPDDPTSNQIDQLMNLDIVLKEDISVLGQIQARISNAGEVEGNTSIIRSGDTPWNHAATISISQLADRHRPQLNLVGELLDGSNRFKKILLIEKQHPPLFMPSSSDNAEKDILAYTFYNALYESENAQANFYMRYGQHDFQKESNEVNYNLLTSRPQWLESSTEEGRTHNSFAKLSWKFQVDDNLVLRVSAHYTHDFNKRDRFGFIEIPPTSSRQSKQLVKMNHQQAELFAHVDWQLDTVWNLQMGLQIGANDQEHFYDLQSDTAFYGLRLEHDSQEPRLHYDLKRRNGDAEIGTSLQRKWNTLDQTFSWTSHHKLRAMVETGNPQEILFVRDEFYVDQTYQTHTTTSVLNYEVEVLGVQLRTQLGGIHFYSDQFLLEKNRYMWTANSRIRYDLDRDKFVYLAYDASGKWLDASKLWRTARPVNLQSYAVAGATDPTVFRTYQLSAGLKEFSRLKGTFSQLNVEYIYEPIHYEWRQKIMPGFNIDTLVHERDFNHFEISIRTLRKIKHIQISAVLAGSYFYSYGIALFEDQLLSNSNLRGEIGLRNILRSEVISLGLRTRTTRIIWKYGEESDLLPPQWNSENTINTRVYINKAKAWFASEISYLWRGAIYDEFILSGSIEKKMGEHFVIIAGVENLLNLNENIRRNRFIAAESFRETEQTVFGGRIFLKVAYKL